jgi:virginiamycin B lyase
MNGGQNSVIFGDVSAPKVRRRGVRGRIGMATAALVLLPTAMVGLLSGSAGASTVGKVSNITGTGISEPYGITAGPNGSLWFANFGNASIGEVSTTGVVSNFTDPTISQPVDITAGPNGALWFTNYGNSSIGEITTAGVVSNFTDPSINHPTGITAGPDGALWFANQGNNSIGRITTLGSVTNFTAPSIVSPLDITSGPNGALWFTNQNPSGSSSIGEITTGGAVSSFTDARLTNPYGIVADGSSLWITNLPGGAGGDDAIEKMSASGAVTHVYTDSSLSNPASIALGSDGDLWFVNNGNASIGRITTTGTISNYTDPTIDGPIWITAGSDGALWFSNQTNNSVGRITTAVTPEIKSFSPTSGAAKQKVTITGKNLAGATVVAVNGTPQKIVSMSASQIVIKIKAGTTSGPITVTTPDGTATSTSNFTI